MKKTYTISDFAPRTNLSTIESLQDWDDKQIIKTFKDVFGVNYEDDDGEPAKIKLFRTPPPAPWRASVPDSRYIYDKDELLMLLHGLVRKRRNRVWIGGYGGTGKSQLPINVFTALNYPFVRIVCDPAMTRTDIHGRWTVKAGTTSFNYSLFVYAMKFGAAVILDEADTMQPEVFGAIRSALEEKATIFIPDTHETIVAHPRFRVFATGNTMGAGDPTGLYQTTNVLSAPDRQRFSIKIVKGFLPEKEERALVAAEFPDLTAEEVRSFVKVANGVRSKYTQNEISEAMSPREILAWIDVYQSNGGDVIEAAEYAILNGYPEPAEVIAVKELIRSTFPKWVLDGEDAPGSADVSDEDVDSFEKSLT